MNQNPSRILIVDDHFMIRLGLTGALADEPDLVVIGEASDGASAIAMFDTLMPDITLMDGMLPDIHGVEVARRILARHPEARIILVSINQTTEDVFQAMDTGAWGYIPKSSQKETIVAAIRQVAAGQRYLPENLARKLRERKKEAVLSPREIEVLRLIATGMANKQIGNDLHVSEATVKSHVAHIMAKLGASDRTSAVTIAIEQGSLRL